MQDYALNLAELHASCERPESLNVYAALVLGEEYKAPFPETHIAYWALLVRAAHSKDERELRYALGLPRGFAKTTLIKLFMTWLYAYTDFQFALCISANLGKSQHVIADVAGMLDSQNYRAVYGNWRAQVETDNSEVKIFFFREKWRVLHAMGAGGSVRGLNIKNRRPDIIILEDAQDRESAMSSVQNDQFMDWLFGTVLKARSAERSIVIFIGNMYNETCCLNQLRKNKLWISLISGCIIQSRESLWPEFRTLQSLLDEYEMDCSVGKGHIFLAELMNDPTAMQQNGFDATLLKPYPFPEDEMPAVSFIIVDPALGKVNSDDTVIGLVHVLEGRPVLRKLIVGKLDDERTLDEAIALALRERAPLIAIESIAFQQTLCSRARRIMQQRNILGITVSETGPRGKAKNARIGDALRKWLSGEIDVHPSIRPQVIAQARKWSPLKKDNEDDILDVLAYVDPVLAENWAYLYSAVDSTFLPPDMEMDSNYPGVADVNQTCCF